LIEVSSRKIFETVIWTLSRRCGVPVKRGGATEKCLMTWSAAASVDVVEVEGRRQRPLATVDDVTTGRQSTDDYRSTSRTRRPRSLGPRRWRRIWTRRTRGDLADLRQYSQPVHIINGCQTVAGSIGQFTTCASDTPTRSFTR